MLAPILRTEEGADALPAGVHGVRSATAAPVVAVVGMGYVGLPTALALVSAGFGLIGIDASESRLQDIRDRSADLIPKHVGRLAAALHSPRFALTSDAAALCESDAIVICVPTPIDADRRPDLRCVEAACETVVEHARPGQTIVLTSTTHVGTTRELLVEPLEHRGLSVGDDVFVAFSPERIDPGNVRHDQDEVPRVIGAVTPACAARACALFAPICAGVHVVSSPEAAELTKLHENSFRAVNIAFANEMAGAALELGLDPVEIVDAAATKPYGFMAFQPGPGVGGHCIPCDPHYLLAPLRRRGHRMPLVERAMEAIADRPAQVVDRAAEVLARDGVDLRGARVLVVGVAYKPGVQDVRESPALEILDRLSARGAQVSYHDPLVRTAELGKLTLLSVTRPRPDDHDLVVVLTVHPRRSYAWLDECERVLDCTYRTASGRVRSLL